MFSSSSILIMILGWNSWWDGYRFYQIKAIFANNIVKMEPGSSVWTSSSTIFCDGCGKGYSQWYQMTKYSG